MTRRERWFGSTGRKVPEVVLVGEIDLGGALMLRSVDDVEALKEAHAAGVPIVVRADSVETIQLALARPEVSCVIVEDEGLLELDLADITYG